MSSSSDYSSSDSDTCEYQGARCCRTTDPVCYYGATDHPVTVITYIMGDECIHWGHYQVHFGADGNQLEVHLECADGGGTHPMHNQVLFFHDEDPDMLLLEDADFFDDHWHPLFHYA